MTEEELQRAFKILDEVLKELNIPCKPSPDGITRINGMTVDEYLKKHPLWDRDNYKDYNLEEIYEQNMRR